MARAGAPPPSSSAGVRFAGAVSLGKIGRLSVRVIEHLMPAGAILEPHAEITADTEAELREVVRRQLTAGRVNLVIDLAHVPYIDSCGLGRIVQAYVSAHRQGGGLKLVNVGDRVRHLLQVTRLLSVLEVSQPNEHPMKA
jgi:anti-sigma B factor antagonist